MTFWTAYNKNLISVEERGMNWFVKKLRKGEWGWAETWVIQQVEKNVGKQYSSFSLNVSYEKFQKSLTRILLLRRNWIGAGPFCCTLTCNQVCNNYTNTKFDMLHYCHFLVIRVSTKQMQTQFNSRSVWHKVMERGITFIHDEKSTPRWTLHVYCKLYPVHSSMMGVIFSYFFLQYLCLFEAGYSVHKKNMKKLKKKHTWKGESSFFTITFL